MADKAAKKPTEDTLSGEPRRIPVLVQAFVLGSFAMVAAALLAGGDLKTHDAIEARHAEDLKASLAQVVPAALHDNDLLAQPLTTEADPGMPATVYRALKDGKVTAVAFEIVGYGYGGAIRLIMGIGRDGRILGVRVLSHSETPGLGDRVEVARSPWIKGFDGLGEDNTTNKEWAVKKDGGRFDQFTGATITPRAVVKAVKAGLDRFARHRKQWLTP